MKRLLKNISAWGGPIVESIVLAVMIDAQPPGGHLSILLTTCCCFPDTYL